MFKNGSVLIAVLCFVILQVLFPVRAQSQTFSYRTYDENTGLPGSYLNVIEQDKSGFLWVGVDSNLFRYDGFDFHRMAFPEKQPRGNLNALFCDREGTVWAGLTDGTLYSWREGGTLVRRKLAASDRINRITEGPDRKIWIVTQTEGIYLADAGGGDKITRLSVPEGYVLFDISFDGTETVIAATQDNLRLCTVSGDRIVEKHSFPELEYTWVHTVRQMDDDTWFAGTDYAGLFMIRRINGMLEASVVGDTLFMNMRIPKLIAGDERSLLVATQETGVLKVAFTPDFSAMETVAVYDIATGLADNNVRTIFRDREENLWIGLYNRGLAAVTTNAFSFHKPETNKEINFIGSIGKQVLMGTRNGLYDYSPVSGTFSNYRPLAGRTGGSGIASWAADDRGNVWIGTVTDGLWVMKPDGSIRQFYRSVNPGQNRINSIAVETGNIWLATLDGVVLLDRETGAQKAAYTTWEMLPHNNVAQVVVNREGEVLVATKSDRLCYIHVTGGVRTEGLVMEGSMVTDIRSISVAPDRTVCAGTYGNGLFLFAGDTLLNYTVADGLLTNFCYSTLIDADGRIWTGHEKGFSVINPATGSVRSFSTDFGVRGDCIANAIARTGDGCVYVGTTEGIIAYNPAMEPKVSVPPQAAIVSVLINGVEYPYRETYNLPYRSSYSVRVRYAGISLRDPLNVVFRTRMENVDEAWSDLTGERSSVTYSLVSGHYRFGVEAMTRDDPDNSSVASFSIVIEKPFTQKWWFILLMLAVTAAVVFVIIRLRERAHRKQREYLENELQKRTAEVYAQKEELAQKNLDITESIKYAKRIQTSVLPDTARLGTVFREAFVFFQPRDIVSGDFYWFDWIDKDRFVLVCSDSTGHGVPGAFMSMIGTALLQDIITVKKITRPSQVLHELDRQIFSTLNQNQEVEASNDGMDIVVCEFNLKTKQLVFSSAMRPVILVIDGEQHYVRGNRASVGGESVTEKFYDDQEYHLREGDAVYLFTDGYCDQFGGQGAKKMKISRLRSFIDEIVPLPMEQQNRKVKEFFVEWKGDNDQVDDVLFMGLRV